MRISPGEYWSSRTPTRHGRVDPMPKKSFRVGESSRAMRRHEQRLEDRRILAQWVQLAPGMLVVHERRPWRIVEVRELPVDLWGERWDAAFDEEIAHWERYAHRYAERPERASWRGRPVSFVLIPDGQPQATPTHLRGPASFDWPVLPEHYAVCVSCGELPPCREELADRQVALDMSRTELLMEIPAGHCLGCGEHITHRQNAERFPGPNLWRPDLGDDSAVFHARKECAGARERYRELWSERGGADAQLALPAFDEEC